jgi:hypothetical protein
MDLTTALEILGRIGSANAPTLSDLTSARDTIARELHRLKGEGNGDLEALLSIRKAYDVSVAAADEAKAAQEKAAEEIDDVLEGVPNPDDEGEESPGDESPGEEDDKGSKGRVLSVEEAVARLGLGGGGGRIEITDREPDLASTKTKVLIGTTESDNATWEQLAEAFRDSGRSLKTGKERVARIETEFASERTLPGKIGENTTLLDSFVSPEAVTAAGGCCSLPEPIFENPVYSSTARPIKASLPSIGTSRGKVSFYPAICLPVDGAALWSCEQDAAVDPEDPATWKECAHIECAESQDAEVSAIYSCVTIGNYQQRFAVEQWRGYLQALAAQQARIAEVALFEQMRAAVSTTHTVEATGSTYVNLINGAALAAATIRQDERLADVRFNLWLPEWIRQAIRADIRVRRVASSATESAELADQVIAQALGNEGIDVVYSPDIDRIEEDSPGQQDGPLSPYPAVASAVLAPNGYFTFLDGGTLDLGTDIRDHELNRQNMVAAFAESWEGLLARGCNAKALDIPVEACETAPCPA